MDREELLDGLTQDVLAYVMRGTFPESYFANQIKPDELDQRFSDYEMLVRLHFILRPEVVDFVERLPKHLRELETKTENVSETVRGSVDGRIRWNRTYRERYARNPQDTALFVQENRSENYDTDENVVLKQLLSIIYNTLNECNEYLRSDYEWVTERWKENLELVDQMTDIFERNVHVTRIREPATYEPTDRMLDRATNSRKTLYREAASLLGKYRASARGEPSAVRDLLETTAITPDDTETLLELFVLFKYISTIEQLQGGDMQVRTLETDRQEVARMATSDGTEIVLYHDNSASDRDLSFDSVPDKEREDLSRHEIVQRKSIETAQSYFKDSRLRSHTGRPDVIVLEISREESMEYLITEIKNSRRQETVRQGIKETLEYLVFLQQNSEFVFGAESDFHGSGWNGVLVVQDIRETETKDFGEQGEQPIRILQASEVEHRIEEILKKVL
jgi:hypothetical protein